MPKLHFSFAALALAALSACNGGQPRVYRVALDVSAARNVTDAPCYAGRVPSNTMDTKEINLRTEEQWVLWDGVAADGSARQYLEMGHQSYTLGTSPQIDFDSLIESTTPLTFVATRTVESTFTTFTEVRRTVLKVDFNDTGATPTGVINLEASYACTPPANCPLNPAEGGTCKVGLPFSARRIDFSRISSQSETGTAQPIPPSN